MKTIRVASVQFNHKPGNKEYNLERIHYFVEIAKQNGVQILVFPEMCITGYWHIRKLKKQEIEDLAEKIPDGASVQKIKKLSIQNNMIIGAGIIEKTNNGKLFNSYIVCMPDGNIQSHKKLHCFISKYMSSGNQFTVFNTALGCKLGILICWDNNIIENVRITALKGADILLAPHQTGGCQSRSPHAMGLIDPELWMNRKEYQKELEEEFKGPKGREWLMRWLPSRAHDNGMFIIFSNGVGVDDNEVRTGNAMIIDPYGRILNETTKTDDDMVISDIDLDLLTMCTGRRWIRGRRPELYGILTKSTGKELDPRAARFSTEDTR